jgi:hypothetical protein
MLDACWPFIFVGLYLPALAMVLFPTPGDAVNVWRALRARVSG